MCVCVCVWNQWEIWGTPPPPQWGLPPHPDNFKIVFRFYVYIIRYKFIILNYANLNSILFIYYV